MIEKSIAEFASRMNMPSFALNEQGLACLEVENSCLFYFEQTENELILYITFPVESYDESAAERILELSHFKYNHPFKLFTGMFSGNGILLTRMPLQNVTSASIENSFHFLQNLLPKALGKV